MTRDARFPPRLVRVLAPARLHLGFLDLAGGLGRRFGSLGLAIDGIGTTATLRVSSDDAVSGADSARAARHLDALRAAWGRGTPVEIRIERAIPPHAGLGSGTQLGLAIGMGLARLHGRIGAAAEIGALLDRGA